MRSWLTLNLRNLTSTGSQQESQCPVAITQERDNGNSTNRQRPTMKYPNVYRVEYSSFSCNVEERDAAWTSNAQIKVHFEALNWAVIPIFRDGNCLFRAISDQLYNNELFHQDIRRRSMDVIDSNRKEFQSFIENEQIGAYSARMRQDGKPGGHVELYAIARLFNIHIVVHTGPARKLRVTNNNLKGSVNSPYRTLHLLYKDRHYNSLIQRKQLVPRMTSISANKVVGVQESKIVRIQDLTRHSQRSNPFEQSVREQQSVNELIVLYDETNLAECGVQLPKQVMFDKGKRRGGGTTLFSLVHNPSSRKSSTSSTVSTAPSASEMEDQANESDSNVSILRRHESMAPTHCAVPVEFPRKTIFSKGRATAA
ncbi:OTU (ovarian tumor)-like cysteine protease [Plasmopara halstedii]|uniref:OTU (Ovarian tumor)-like cysteine protease n=1 Tax=Plasmopara halstedii TaxID=4781 RepID=A0A0P1AAD2_PLAHL|nr:OTU (ovarian tumor)-like cysteine protease [Plasmopara halstedii]CEG37821.1 OTU (ovarian tumor)-like cysteine protease [Plasmopara halstedii]|eukprot:XP_024574190.1 OTU (ovarian tumor)-like cysteine protease [Plasmopara halstedii]